MSAIRSAIRGGTSKSNAQDSVLKTPMHKQLLRRGGSVLSDISTKTTGDDVKNNEEVYVTLVSLQTRTSEVEMVSIFAFRSICLCFCRLFLLVCRNGVG